MSQWTRQKTELAWLIFLSRIWSLYKLRCPWIGFICNDSKLSVFRKKVSEMLDNNKIFRNFDPWKQCAHETPEWNTHPFPPSRQRKMDARWHRVFTYHHPNLLIFNNLHRFCNNGEFRDKTQGRQAQRLATELSRLGKNKFIQTLSPQWKRLPFAGT